MFAPVQVEYGKPESSNYHSFVCDGVSFNLYKMADDSIQGKRHPFGKREVYEEEPTITPLPAIAQNILDALRPGHQGPELETNLDGGAAIEMAVQKRRGEALSSKYGQITGTSNSSLLDSKRKDGEPPNPDSGSSTTTSASSKNSTSDPDTSSLNQNTGPRNGIGAGVTSPQPPTTEKLEEGNPAFQPATSLIATPPAQEEDKKNPRLPRSLSFFNSQNNNCWSWNTTKKVGKYGTLVPFELSLVALILAEVSHFTKLSISSKPLENIDKLNNLVVNSQLAQGIGGAYIGIGVILALIWLVSRCRKSDNLEKEVHKPLLTDQNATNSSN